LRKINTTISDTELAITIIGVIVTTINNNGVTETNGDRTNSQNIATQDGDGLVEGGIRMINITTTNILNHNLVGEDGLAEGESSIQKNILVKELK